MKGAQNNRHTCTLGEYKPADGRYDEAHLRIMQSPSTYPAHEEADMSALGARSRPPRRSHSRSLNDEVREALPYSCQKIVPLAVGWYTGTSLVALSWSRSSYTRGISIFFLPMPSANSSPVAQ